MKLRAPALVPALLLGLAASVASAPLEIDGDLMRGIDDTAKSLDSSVAQKDAKSAAALAKDLVDTFGQVESHYAATPDTADAVGFASRTQAYAEDVLKALDSGNFDAAADAVDKLTHSCKSCHDVYKKE